MPNFAKECKASENNPFTNYLENSWLLPSKLNTHISYLLTVQFLGVHPREIVS